METKQITLTRTPSIRYRPTLIARRAVEEDGTLVCYSYNKDKVSIQLDDPKNNHDFSIEIPNSVILQIAEALKASDIVETKENNF